jgi:emp24/gp25L/p24 family/GOLD
MLSSRSSKSPSLPSSLEGLLRRARGKKREKEKTTNIKNLQEVFDGDHRVVASKGASSGKFTFTAADSGDHKICFTPSHSTGHSGWLHTGQSLGGVKLTLDLAIGETSAIESQDKDKILDIVQKVKDLNMRLQDIKREQVFQRVSRFITLPHFLASELGLQG